MLSETYLELLIPITDTLLQFLGIGLSVYTDYLPDLVPLAQYLQIHVYGLTDLACQQFDLTVVHVETGCPMDMLHVWHDQLNGLVEQTKKAALGFSHAWTEEPLNQTAFKESRITSAHQVLKSCFHLLEHLESMETLKKNTWFKIEKDHGETLMSLTEDTLEVKVAWLKKHIQRVPRLYQALLEHRVPNPRWERLCEEYAQTAKMLAWSVAFPLPYRLPHVHRYLSLCQQLQKPLPFETCTFTSPEPDRIWNLLQGLPHLTHSSLSTSIYLPFKSVGHPWNPMQWTSFVDNAQHLEKYLRPTSSELSSFLPILKSAAQALVASSTDALLLTYAQHVFSEWEKLVEWHLQFFHTSFLEFQVILVAGIYIFVF
ncbi:hypothetical protein HMI54_010746 [Coelomomyces lativittatus]|nr:hypothetical protein HMI56_004033 [Coelomomyces lativittatus]KAJ1500513.1 hypothetical protein HMI54_010746 [Coelomomyces lativittatus]